MQKASTLHEGGIYAIGNAPTALLELIRLIKEGLAKPDLIIGMPVGFVSAAESKEELLKLEGIPYITNVGRKGGSTVTVAALNAISLLADEQAKNNGAEAKKDPKDMRHGYTTGACATAVSKAALLALITKEEQETSTIHLPIGRDATFTIEKCIFEENAVSCETIKDAGDDPDATHQALIVGTVSWADTRYSFRWRNWRRACHKARLASACRRGGH